MSERWMEWLSTHVGTMVGTLLIVPFLARILRERRAPGSTLAWILSVVLVPYIGVPLYLALGPRKRHVASRKPLYAPAATSAAGASAEARAARPIEALLAAVGVPSASGGNAVELLATGEAAFTRLLDVIGGARRSIHVATFILGDDVTGNTVLERLTEKAATGVDVRVLLDGLFLPRANRRKLAALRRAGGRVVEFGPMIHLPFRGTDNLRNHRKLVVVDDEIAIVGGMNIAEEYMGPNDFPGRFRDVAVCLAGPAVARVAEVYRSDWAFAAHETLEPRALPAPRGEAIVQVVPSGPDSVDDTLYETLLAACYWAKRRIAVATPYFVPDEALARALAAASRRGLDVRIVVPARSNHLLADLAGGTYLRQVEAARARVATYPRMLHAKVVVIDDDVAVLGSANFDMRSLFLNYEVALFFYSRAEVDMLSRWFEDVSAECGRLAPAGRVRALGEEIGRLLAPIL
jgi:cardiolipin synthase